MKTIYYIILYIRHKNIKMRKNKKIFVILLFFALTIRTLYSACLDPTLPFAYASSCYAECPWVPPVVTYLDSTSNNCVTGNNSCNEDCPSPTYFADDSTKKCVTSINDCYFSLPDCAHSNLL
jgi:hypothetical protein